MMHPLQRIIVIFACLVGSVCWAEPVAGNNNAGNDSGGFQPKTCAAIYAKDCRRDLTFDPVIVRQCMQHGFDPPSSCRKNQGRSAGVRVGGSSGFSYGTIQAPEKPPGVVGARPSANIEAIHRSMGKPRLSGNFCMLFPGFDICKLLRELFQKRQQDPTLDPTPPNLLCPAKNDTSPRYGTKQALRAGSFSLTCGGAVPLSTYEVTVTRNADRIAITEYGSPYLWLYKRSGNSYMPNGANPVKLPSYLCKAGIKTVDLTAPIAQFITYDANAENITLRLKPRAKIDAGESEEILPEYDLDEPEKFLIIPIVGDVVNVPEDCAEESKYFMDIKQSRADIAIESAVNDGCEGSVQQCAGLPIAPAPTQSCDVISYPAGNTCPQRMQYVVVDRPNLVHPPGAVANLRKIDGRTALMSATVEGSKIYMQTETYVRFGSTAPAITLPEGGMLLMADGKRLNMLAPATINPSTKQLTLTGGGQLLSAGATLIKEFPAGSTIAAPNPVLPLTVHVRRSMKMPPGFELPTQPAPYIQLPAQ